MKHKLIIIDDDRLICEKLNDLVATHFSEAEVVTTCSSGEEGVQAIRSHKPQLVFLDILMPGMNGFEMLKYVSQFQFELIFVTAHNEYAIEAIRHSALDYLLKPLKLDEFKSAIARYLEKINTSTSLEKKIESLEQNLAEKEISEHKLVIHSTRGSEIIPVTDIMYCTSESNYTEIFLHNGKKILASKTLGYFEEELSGSGIFLRIHRSTLLNKKYVQKISGNGEVELLNGQRLEISQRKLAEVKLELEK